MAYSESDTSRSSSGLERKRPGRPIYTQTTTTTTTKPKRRRKRGRHFPHCGPVVPNSNHHPLVAVFRKACACIAILSITTTMSWSYHSRTIRGKGRGTAATMPTRVLLAEAFRQGVGSARVSRSYPVPNQGKHRWFHRIRNDSQTRRFCCYNAHHHSAHTTHSSPFSRQHAIGTAVGATRTGTPRFLFSTAGADAGSATSDGGCDSGFPATAEPTETPFGGDYDPCWKDSPLVNPSITFDTLLVPSAQLTRWITHPELQHRLAKPDNWGFLKHVHPRIKMVQDYEPGEGDEPPTDAGRHTRYKQLLLLPSSVPKGASNHTATGVPPGPQQTDGGDDVWLAGLLASPSDESGGEEATVAWGPPRTMPIAYHQLSFQYLLKRLLPEEVHPPPSAYEQIGHVAHFNLKEKHLPFGRLIGEALLASSTTSSGGSNHQNSNSIKTVVNKLGKVDGKFRTYECQILADAFLPDARNSARNDDGSTTHHHPSSSLETTVVEDGVSIRLNVAECYWCTRLSGERKELVKDIVCRSNPSSDNPVVVADVFCGAGAVCMLLAKKIRERTRSHQQQLLPRKQKEGKGAQPPILTVLANDWNPKAIEYMEQSIAANGMDNKEKDDGNLIQSFHRFELSCRDSYDFLFELGEELPVPMPPSPKVRRNRKLGRKPAKNVPAAADSPRTTEDSNDRTKRIQWEQKRKPLPDHVLMNFPLEAPRFLGALRWWSWKRLEQGHLEKSTAHQTWFPRFHVYTFARSSEPKAGDEEEMAINVVANELLPPYVFADETCHGNRSADGDRDENEQIEVAKTVVFRRKELNEEFGTDISTRMVRDVAPGKVVVCVSFSVTPKLIRYMQGDYS
ncbi:unnamed protein product [Pseudo-nitzschia multistriata]|uniref:tRNA (guanine(37)-N1)-methyltransferase n=1 Tax=Pseudo-nitzschia multistriata TaxID=183589 RepID=A0A448Z985_9STRA|nr:unnamed protein product [Pseudo-nitzschia multistriata]